ncbi:hypothetical protein [Endozoicomonas sp. SCSIO W0465]|uniref:hypothetical protein n=1 Tax=Endozoicomonas sp. SCSIO W0465 TaxID=2918516 RepID=UPI002075C84A|nr:hypothetical protein [Endozoicomonas sp. SCSIO W0465]USE36213.1 hypothetical protein MJO57_29940 [Endozoicomonas sp. SCSIO W0465]
MKKMKKPVHLAFSFGNELQIYASTGSHGSHTSIRQFKGIDAIIDSGQQLFATPFPGPVS